MLSNNNVQKCIYSSRVIAIAETKTIKKKHFHCMKWINETLTFFFFLLVAKATFHIFI